MCRNKRYYGTRLKKIRGWKKKHRTMVKISGVTPEGFFIRTFNREYYVSREKCRWFKNATQQEIQNVVLFPCGSADPLDDYQPCYDNTPDDYLDHGDHLHWELLDVDLGTNDILGLKGRLRSEMKTG